MKEYLFAIVLVRALGLLMAVVAAGNLFAAAIAGGDNPLLGYAAAFAGGAAVALIFTHELATWAVSGAKSRCTICGSRLAGDAAGPCRTCEAQASRPLAGATAASERLGR